MMCPRANVNKAECGDGHKRVQNAAHAGLSQAYR